MIKVWGNHIRKYGKAALATIIALGTCLVVTPQWAQASRIDPVFFGEEQSAAFKLSQRGQQQLGYAGGNIISDIEWATLISPYFEIGLRLRVLARYGSLLSNSFASSTGGTDNSIGFGGYDRPMIRARQLVYGNFERGRWYILDLGLSMFNASGYVSEFFRYWSARVAMHESLRWSVADPQFEMGLTVRSLTEFSQPSNIGLIYPPSLDFLVGLRKKLSSIVLTSNFRLEQSLAETKIAGSYDSTKYAPTGAPTYLVVDGAVAWNATNTSEFSLSVGDRILRWPDNASSAIWNFFEEGYFGRSFTLAWKAQW